MYQKIKKRLIYSYTGILVSGAAVCAVAELAALAVRRTPLFPRSILRLFVVVAAALTVLYAVSNACLLRHEGIHPTNVTGSAFCFVWMLGNVLCLAVDHYVPGARLLCVFMTLFGCYLDFFISGMFTLAYLAARHKPRYDKDFVIILGCSISKQGGLLPLLKARANRAIRFAWDQERETGKPARYIPTGGQGPDEIISEGSAIEMYLLSHGAEQYEILPEKASVNTRENMLFAKRIIDEEKPGAKVCYATTNYHVLRSGMLARKAGLDAEGLSSKTKWYFWPNGFAREMIAMFAMYPLQQLAALAVILILAVTIAL